MPNAFYEHVHKMLSNSSDVFIKHKPFALDSRNNSGDENDEIKEEENSEEEEIKEEENSDDERKEDYSDEGTL